MKTTNTFFINTLIELIIEGPPSRWLPEEEVICEDLDLK